MMMMMMMMMMMLLLIVEVVVLCVAGCSLIADVANARPLSIPTFLQQKEEIDPDFARARKNFAPAFSILVSIIKQDALKASGRHLTHDGRRHNYTEADKHVMQEAWELTCAFRESLLGRANASASDARPSVMELLQRAR